MGPIGSCLKHFRYRWIVKSDFSLAYFAWKWADLIVFKAFISNSFTKALKMLKSAHFHAKSSQICQWKIDFDNPTMSKMVQTSPNRSQTSKLIIRNTFWTSRSHIRFALKKAPHPPNPKKIPIPKTLNNDSKQSLRSANIPSSEVIPRSVPFTINTIILILMCFWWLILMFGTDWDMFEPFSTPLWFWGSIFH